MTLSSDAVIVPGRIGAMGTEGVYRRLRDRRAEERMTRTDLSGGGRPAAGRRSLLHLAHVTDTHIVDAASPGRFEFADRLYEVVELRHLLPTYRPQEMLSLHALEAMVQAIDTISASPVTGAPLSAVLFTGDLVDNAQRNELSRFLAVVTGQTVRPAGNASYEGVADIRWGDAAYWRPDGGDDTYQRRWGYPGSPGLLAEMARPFASAGLRHPWLACRGNHDLLAHGTAIPSTAYEAILAGSRKPADFPVGTTLSADPEQFERFLSAPERLLHGESHQITPDAERVSVPMVDFMPALRSARGNLLGPPEVNGSAGACAYHAYDGFARVRLLLLDTVNGAGHWDGCLDAGQYAWLEQRLIEVHSRYWDEAGRQCETGHDDRIVVVACHHPLHTLTNLRGAGQGNREAPPLGTMELLLLLHRFPNVVLLLNGHIHCNRIRAHRDPAGRTAGFWEVTTSSLVDWPCEARLIELADNCDGTLSILTTMIASAAPADPAEAVGVLRLAAIHRELAANDPHAGWRSDRAGEPGDRTADLRIPAPAGILREREPAGGGRSSSGRQSTKAE